MAALTFIVGDRLVRLWARLETLLAACRERLDSFVSSWMRHAAADVAYVRPKHRWGA